jgi:hypothetical protein
MKIDLYFDRMEKFLWGGLQRQLQYSGKLQKRRFSVRNNEF